MDVFKRLLKLAKPHAVKFSIAMICMLVVGATTSALAFLVQPALDEPDVVGDPGHECACRVLREEGERLGLDLPVEGLPEVGHNPLTDEIHENRLGIVARTLH